MWCSLDSRSHFIDLKLLNLIELIKRLYKQSRDLHYTEEEKLVDEEKLVELKNNFDSVLETMGISVYLDDIYRFTKKDLETGAKKDGISPVRVQFVSSLDKELFMANLGSLKHSPFRNLSIGVDVPKCLLPKFYELDTIGFNFRKQNPGGRTKIGFKNGDLIAFGRLKDQTTFKPL